MNFSLGNPWCPRPPLCIVNYMESGEKVGAGELQVRFPLRFLFVLIYEQVRLNFHSTKSVSAPWGRCRLCGDTWGERHHDQALVLVQEMVFRNSSLMAALGVGDARTLWVPRHAYASAKRRASFENVFAPLFLSPWDDPSPCTSPPVYNFRQVFLFHQLVTTNHDFGLHLEVPIRCKTLIVNHYLRTGYFKQWWCGRDGRDGRGLPAIRERGSWDMVGIGTVESGLIQTVAKLEVGKISVGLYYMWKK